MLMIGDDNEIKEKRIREREEHLCDMFMIFDKNKDGYISGEELSSVMMKFGGLDKTQLDIMIGEADSDGDGQVVKTYLHTSRKIYVLNKHSSIAQN